MEAHAEQRAMLEFEVNEDIADDEDSGGQLRIQSLQRQQMFWQERKANQNARCEKSPLYLETMFQHTPIESPDQFANYFRKYNGMSAKLINSQLDRKSSDSDTDQQANNETRKSDLVVLQQRSLLQSVKQFEVHKESQIKGSVLSRKKAGSKVAGTEGEDGTQDYDTLVPYEDESCGLGSILRLHSMQTPKQRLQNQQQVLLESPAKLQQDDMKANGDGGLEEFGVLEQDESQPEEMNGFLKEQELLRIQAEMKMVVSPAGESNSVIAFDSAQSAIKKEEMAREYMLRSSSDGVEEVRAEEKEYFHAGGFRSILMRGILRDLMSESQQDRQSEDYLIVMRDDKWNRVYLKRVNIYVQLRVFRTREQFRMYIDSYEKIVSRFIRYMPQTVFVDEEMLVVVQRLGDFSLYDFANLVLIEAKQNEGGNYQKYYLSIIRSLFDSIILILSHNYFIGNLTPKNVFLSRNRETTHGIKFSNLVDFSFDYSKIANPHYALLFATKPSEIDVWFSELYACCRCVQELMERDKQHLKKSQIKEFIKRHKQKNPKLMGIMSFFLLRNEAMHSGVNLDLIQQFLQSSFGENSSDAKIQLSQRSIRHVERLVQSSQLHLTSALPDVMSKSTEEQCFFWVQQLHFHQDFSDNEMKCMLRFANRLLFACLFNNRNKRETHSSQESTSLLSDAVLHKFLGMMVSDAAVFRKDKEIQRMSYLLYVMLKLKHPSSKTKSQQKAEVYWRYLSQTCSPLSPTDCCPIALFCSGLFHYYSLDFIKASKWSNNSVEYSNNKHTNRQEKSCGDLDRENKGKEVYKFKDKSQRRKPSISPESKDHSISPDKKKAIAKTQVELPTHNNHSCENEQQYLHVADKNIESISVAYNALGLLRTAFLSESSPRKSMERIIEGIRAMKLESALIDVIENEILIVQSLMKSMSVNASGFYFVDTAVEAHNINVLMQATKTLKNQMMLVDNLSKLVTMGGQKELVKSGLVQALNLFGMQAEMGTYISESALKKKQAIPSSGKITSNQRISSQNRLN